MYLHRDLGAAATPGVTQQLPPPVQKSHDGHGHQEWRNPSGAWKWDFFKQLKGSFLLCWYQCQELVSTQSCRRKVQGGLTAEILPLPGCVFQHHKMCTFVGKPPVSFDKELYGIITRGPFVPVTRSPFLPLKWDFSWCNSMTSTKHSYSIKAKLMLMLE